MIDSFIATADSTPDAACTEQHHLYEDCPVLVARKIVSGHHVYVIEWPDRQPGWLICGRCEERAAQEVRPVVVILNDPYMAEIYNLSLQEAADTLDFLHGPDRLNADADEWDRMGAEDAADLDYEVREISVLDLSRVQPVDL